MEVAEPQPFDPLLELLLSEVVSGYDIASPTACTRLHSGLNDIYLIKTGGDPFILKLYRAGWRTRAEVLYEMDVLLHLDRKGVSVSLPAARRDGGYAWTVDAPEGIRQAVLFTYAKGQSDAPVNEGYCYRFGGAAADMHSATEDFASPHARFHLDLEHLLHQPLQALRPLLEHRPADWDYLQRLARRLGDGITSLPTDALDWGYCHGDLAPNNVHAANGTLTLFDFDCGGPGWRSYDIALFRTFLLDERERCENHEPLWEAFVSGYTERRRLTPIDLEVVPLFVAMRQIWILGVHATISQASGFASLPRFFDGMLRFLREWESQNHP